MKINEREHKTVLVELDCLLDTRAATLWLKDPEIAKDAFADDYHHRFKDKFKGISDEEFAELYAARDKQTLFQSSVTPMKYLVLDFCKKTIEQMLSSPYNYTPKVEINIHPYVLTDEEKDLIKQVFIVASGDMIDVEIVSYDYEYLNPLFVKENYELMIMYHYGKWLDAQSKEERWKKYTCPGVGLIAPMIYMDNSVDINADKKEGFQQTIDFIRPFVDLSLLPIEMFSFVIAKKDKTQTNENT